VRIPSHSASRPSLRREDGLSEASACAKNRRGALQPGDRVAVVEDTVTRGTSIFEAVEAIKEFGAVPVVITVIVDRGGTCAAMSAEAGITYVPMLTAPDLGYSFGS